MLVNDSHDFDLYITSFDYSIADFDHAVGRVELLSAYSYVPLSIRSLYCHFVMCQFFGFELQLPEHLSKGRIEFISFLKKRSRTPTSRDRFRFRNQKSYFTGVNSITGILRVVLRR